MLSYNFSVVNDLVPWGYIQHLVESDFSSEIIWLNRSMDWTKQSQHYFDYNLKFSTEVEDSQVEKLKGFLLVKEEDSHNINKRNYNYVLWRALFMDRVIKHLNDLMLNTEEESEVYEGLQGKYRDYFLTSISDYIDLDTLKDALKEKTFYYAYKKIKDGMKEDILKKSFIFQDFN